MASHEENLKKVCILCLGKRNLRGISKKNLEDIKLHYIFDIDLKPWNYPVKICANCTFSLSSEKPLEIPNYSSHQVVKTRNSSTKCECDICCAARITLVNLHPGASKPRKPGQKKTPNAQRGMIIIY